MFSTKNWIGRVKFERKIIAELYHIECSYIDDTKVNVYWVHNLERFKRWVKLRLKKMQYDGYCYKNIEIIKSNNRKLLPGCVHTTLQYQDKCYLLNHIQNNEDTSIESLNIQPVYSCCGIWQCNCLDKECWCSKNSKWNNS